MAGNCRKGGGPRAGREWWHESRWRFQWSALGARSEFFTAAFAVIFAGDCVLHSSHTQDMEIDLGPVLECQRPVMKKADSERTTSLLLRRTDRVEVGAGLQNFLPKLSRRWSMGSGAAGPFAVLPTFSKGSLNSMTPSATPLPYTDTKPHGHADFYFAINATFRFILARFGIESLRRYWQQMGADYHRPVSELWRLGGLPAVAAHWRAFFAAEPGAEVEVIEGPEEVRLEVRTCPMIKHLREHGREIVACLCQHCYYVSEAMAG